MEKVFDSIFAALMTVFLAAGSGYAIKQMGRAIKHAALDKAHGLPALSPFATQLGSKN